MHAIRNTSSPRPPVPECARSRRLCGRLSPLSIAVLGLGLLSSAAQSALVRPPGAGRAKPAAAAADTGARRRRRARSFPSRSTRSPNGLEVILHEDHRVPQVAVDVWYKVGSKDEQPGRTGFAHLFEHVMFQGSKHVGEDKHFALLQKAGVSNANGSTSEDRTNYFEVVPANQLELALWLESDRMGFLLDRPGLQETFDGQRDVVKNERRQRVENRPMGIVNKITIEALFPPNHPYHHEVIGSMEDLTVARLDDVRNFFNRWYVPNNAALVIAGDFDSGTHPGPGRAILRPHPGWPSGEPVRAASRGPRSGKAPGPGGEGAAAAAFHRIPHAGAFRAWRSRAGRRRADPGWRKGLAPLPPPGLRPANRSDRERRAAEPAPRQHLRDLGLAHARSHRRRTAVQVIDQELEKLRTTPAEPRELLRAQNQIEFDTFRNLEPLLARAERLQTYNYVGGDPGLLQRDLASYRAVDAAAVQQAAARHLRKDARVVITVTPNPEAPIMGRVRQ